LRTLKKNIQSGDLVSKAVEDLAIVVKEIILEPFAHRRHRELLECLKELRRICLLEDEIETWNETIREIKDLCIANVAPNNPTFWKEIKEIGPMLGLISRSEAAGAGGKSSVTEATASRFIQS